MFLAEKVYAAVRLIPCGKVASYSQIAALLGNRNLRRFVGNALHKNPSNSRTPCHRVVNAKGFCSGSFAFGGKDIQRQKLEEEGVLFTDGHVDMARCSITEDDFEMMSASLAQEGQNEQHVLHSIPPVWSKDSTILILGSMPSPKSREAGFFYMHPQNRFWRVLHAVYGEELRYPNNAADRNAAIAERRDFLFRHNIALWDVLARCTITGASDSSIRQAEPNSFHAILQSSRITRVFCTGKTAFSLWQKLCAPCYEAAYGITSTCLPSTSPANAAYSLERLVQEYRIIL